MIYYLLKMHSVHCVIQMVIENLYLKKILCKLLILNIINWMIYMQFKHKNMLECQQMIKNYIFGMN
jgi:hypothetical protein